MALELTEPAGLTATPVPTTRAWGRLPELALSIALGLFLICLADALGRNGEPYADVVYWAGQLTMFAPVIARLLSSSLRHERETIGLVLLLVAAYYAAKVCYAPLDFAFNDEFQHWRTAQNILITKHLFDYNYALPISPYYPGLEAVTTAVSELTGLSIFSASLIVMAAARLLLTMGLYLLFRQISGSTRVAGLASVLYTTTFYYKSILAMFIYTNLALPLLVLVLYGSVRLTTTPRSKSRWRAWLVLVLLLATTVVTHHLTSYALILALGLTAVVYLLSRQARDGMRLLALAAVGVGFVAAWLLLVAPQTVAYLEPAVSNLVTGIADARAGHTPAYGGLLHSPPLDRVLSYAGILLIAGCLPIGWREIWRTQRHNPWALSMLIGSAGFYAVPVIRLVSADGTEHAARALNYLFIPIGYVLAVAGVGLLDRARRLLMVNLATVTAVLIMAGGITSGWPQYWERVPPGKFLVGGYESGVGPEGFAAAYWSQEFLRTGRRIAADDNNFTLMGPIGQHNMLHGIDSLYLGGEFTSDDLWLIRHESVEYLVVDLRLAQQLPASGEYFNDGPSAAGLRIPLAALTKFDRVQGAQRVLDGGNIVIYDLRGVTDAP